MKNLIGLAMIAGLIAGCGGGGGSGGGGNGGGGDSGYSIIPNAEHSVILADRMYREDDSAFKVRLYVKDSASNLGSAMNSDFYAVLQPSCMFCDGAPVTLDNTHKKTDEHGRVYYETEYGEGAAGNIGFDLMFTVYPGGSVPPEATLVALQKFSIRSDICNESLNSDGHREPLYGEAKYARIGHIQSQDSNLFYPVCDASDFANAPRVEGEGDMVDGIDILTNFILMNDIDLSSHSSGQIFPNNTATYQTYNYVGTIDGNYKTISNYTDSQPFMASSGFGSRVYALTIDNFSVTGEAFINSGALFSQGGEFRIVNVEGSTIVGHDKAGSLSGAGCYADSVSISEVTVAARDVASVVCDTVDSSVFGGLFSNNIFEDTNTDGAFTAITTYTAPAGEAGNSESGSVINQ